MGKQGRLVGWRDAASLCEVRERQCTHSASGSTLAVSFRMLFVSALFVFLHR